MSTNIDEPTRYNSELYIVQLYAQRWWDYGKRRFYQKANRASHKQRRFSPRVNLPSMTTFFYICDYLGIEPRDFFDTESTNPTKANELLEIAKSLSSEQLDNLIVLAKGLQK